MRAACSTGKYRSPYGSELLSWSASSAGCWSHLYASWILKKSGIFIKHSRLNFTALNKTEISFSSISRMRSAFVIVFGTYAPHGHVKPEPVRQSSYLVQFSHFIITHALSALSGRQAMFCRSYLYLQTLV